MTTIRPGPPKIPSSVRPCTDTLKRKALDSLIVEHYSSIPFSQSPHKLKDLAYQPIES